MESQMLDLGLVVPELVLALTAAAAVLLGSVLPRRRQWLVQAFGLAGTAAAGLAAAVSLREPGTTTAGGTYTVDTTLGLARIAVLVAVAAVLLLAGDGMRGAVRETEFVVLVLLAGLGSIVLAGASDLLVLAVGYLLASVPVYALIALDRSGLSTEAGLKYYLLSALFGLLMLLGVVVLIATGGGTGYRVLAQHLPQAPVAAAGVGALAVGCGLLFKAGAVPAHFWVPDVLDGAPPAVGAFLSTATKVGGVAALLRLSAEAFPRLPLDWPLLVAVVAAATMTLGNLGALLQTRARRLLAYSTISQVGYLLMIVAAVPKPAVAVPAVLFYLIGYTVTNLGAFAVVAALPRAETLDDYTGLFTRHRWLATSLVVTLLGLLGTPPTAVFVGKLAAFAAAFDADLWWLAVLAAVNTVASAFYYLRWILRLFRPAGEPEQAGPAPWSRTTAVALAVSTVLVGVAASPLFGLAQPAAAR